MPFTKYDFETYNLTINNLLYSLKFISTSENHFEKYSIVLTCNGSTDDVYLSSGDYVKVFNFIVKTCLDFLEEPMIKKLIISASIKVLTNKTNHDEYELYQKTKFYLLVSDRIKEKMSYPMHYIQENNTITYFTIR